MADTEERLSAIQKKIQGMYDRVVTKTAETSQDQISTETISKEADRKVQSIFIERRLERLLGQQVAEEFASATVYLNMASYFQDKNLPGFCHWLKVQAYEETGHAMKIWNFVVERQGGVKLTVIDVPQSTWSSPADAIKSAWKQEKHISDRGHVLKQVAKEEQDYAADAFLDWFMIEQVHEEDQTYTLFQQMQSMDQGQLVLLDLEMAKRQPDGDTVQFWFG